MTNEEYNQLKTVSKILNKKSITAAIQGESKNFNGHSIFKAQTKFCVIQNRKGRRDKNKLTYVLIYRNNPLIRVDIHGTPHKGIPTPHMHIYNAESPNGSNAIALADVKNYDPNDDIIISLKVFLDYCAFITKDILVKIDLNI